MSVNVSVTLLGILVHTGRCGIASESGPEVSYLNLYPMRWDIVYHEFEGLGNIVTTVVGPF